MRNYIICLVVSSSERAEVKKKKRYKPECGQNGVEFFFYFQPIVSFEWNAQTNRNILMFLLLQNIFHRLHFQPRVFTTIHCEQTGCQSLVRSLKQTIWFFLFNLLSTICCQYLKDLDFQFLYFTKKFKRSFSFVKWTSKLNKCFVNIYMYFHTI